MCQTCFGLSHLNTYHTVFIFHFSFLRFLNQTVKAYISLCCLKPFYSWNMIFGKTKVFLLFLFFTWFLMYHLAFLPFTLSLQVKWTSSQVPILIVLRIIIIVIIIVLIVLKDCEPFFNRQLLDNCSSKIHLCVSKVFMIKTHLSTGSSIHSTFSWKTHFVKRDRNRNRIKSKKR